MENETLSLATIFEIDESYKSTKFLKLRLKIHHNNKSKKKIRFLDKAIENAKDSLLNSPILAKVVFDAKNIPDFNGHDMHIEVDANGNKRIIYDELPIGVIPEESNYEIEQLDNETSYVSADAYIWRGYSNYAEDVITKNKKISLSMEVKYTDIRYNKEDDVYDVYDFIYLGITLIGKKHVPAMQGTEANLIEINKDDSKNTFSFKDLSKSIIDVFTENIKSEMKGGKFVEDDELVENTDTNTDNTEGTDNGNQDDVFEENIENTETVEIDSFELTYKDIRNRIYDALEKVKFENAYAYFIDSSDEYIYLNIRRYVDGKFNKTEILRFNYKIEDSLVIIDEESAIEVIAQYITKEEMASIEKDRQTFEVLIKEKEEFEDKIRKDELTRLFSTFEDRLSENEEFIELKKNCDELDINDIEKECYAILGKSQFTESSIQVVRQKVVKEKETTSSKISGYGEYLSEFYEENK